jgi:hypothetical protein
MELRSSRRRAGGGGGRKTMVRVSSYSL